MKTPLAGDRGSEVERALVASEQRGGTPNTADRSRRIVGESEPGLRKRLPKSLVLFLCLLLLFTGLSLARMFHGRLVRGAFLPFEPLFIPNPGFDFYVFQSRMPYVHHDAFFAPASYPWMYPAPAAPLYALLYKFNFKGDAAWGWRVLACLSLGGCVFGVLKLCKASSGTKASGILFWTTFLLAWPVYFSLQRGNTESLLWLFVALGIWAFRRERWTASAVLIGFAAAFKIYPILCLGLFVPQRQWRQIGMGAAVMTLVTLASLWFINPDLAFALKHVSQGVHLFTVQYAAGVGLGPGMYDHSLLELLKVVFQPTSAFVLRWMNLYLVVVGASLLAVFLLRMVKMPLANLVLFLTVASIFVPPASFDYTLQVLYIPWAWIALGIIRMRTEERWWHFAIMGFLAVELAPMTFVMRQGVSQNGLVKGVALLGLFILAASKRFHTAGFAGSMERTVSEGPESALAGWEHQEA